MSIALTLSIERNRRYSHTRAHARKLLLLLIFNEPLNQGGGGEFDMFTRLVGRLANRQFRNNETTGRSFKTVINTPAVPPPCHDNFHRHLHDRRPCHGDDGSLDHHHRQKIRRHCVYNIIIYRHGAILFSRVII